MAKKLTKGKQSSSARSSKSIQKKVSPRTSPKPAPKAKAVVRQSAKAKSARTSRDKSDLASSNS